MTRSSPIVHMQDVAFTYPSTPPFSLHIPTVSIQRGQQWLINGPSGSGKTTFLNLLTGLIQPHSGHIHVLDTDITNLTQSACDRFRSDHMGIIFQWFNLIHYLSVLENIVLPCTFSQARKHRALTVSASLADEATRLCHELDMDTNLLQRPVAQLSIGQQQRVAIARALIGQPDIIIADEPTSSLDDARTMQFMRLLQQACEQHHITLIFVSHHAALQSQFHHVHDVTQNQVPT